MAAGIDDYRRKCWDAALHAHGTSYIFQKRASRLKHKTDVLTWIGFAVPLVIGALVGTFGRDRLWGVVLVVGSVIAAAQLVISLWSLVKRWPEELAYSSASATANESLAQRFAALGEDPPGLAALRTQLEKLNVEDTARRERDNEKNVTEKERRMGMRRAPRIPAPLPGLSAGSNHDRPVRLRCLRKVLTASKERVDGQQGSRSH